MSGPPDLSPREAKQRFLDTLRVENRESTVSSYHYRLKLFVAWCGRHGIDSISDLDGWDLESYEAHRRSKDLAPLTLNREMNTLQNMLEYLARVEVVDPELPEKVHIPDVDRDQRSNDRRLGTDAATQLLEYHRENNHGAREHVLLELLWYTGARIGAIRALDVRDYHDGRGFVDFRHRPETGTPLKNGLDGERPVSLPDPVVDALDTYLAVERWEKSDDHGRQPLLSSRSGRPVVGTLRTWTYEATVPCLHSPCPHEKDPDTCEWTEYSAASQCPSSRSPHRIRTGAITWMLNCGVPVEVVSERVNSSVEVIEQHYDKEDPVEEMERRRRPELDRLKLPDSDPEDATQ